MLWKGVGLLRCNDAVLIRDSSSSQAEPGSQQQHSDTAIVNTCLGLDNIHAAARQNLAQTMRDVSILQYI